MPDRQINKKPTVDDYSAGGLEVHEVVLQSSSRNKTKSEILALPKADPSLADVGKKTFVSSKIVSGVDVDDFSDDDWDSMIIEAESSEDSSGNYDGVVNW